MAEVFLVVKYRFGLPRFGTLFDLLFSLNACQSFISCGEGGVVVGYPPPRWARALRAVTCLFSEGCVGTILGGNTAVMLRVFVCQ